MPPPKRFPRWRVFQRVRARTEADVAGLWGAVIVAVAFGLVGAFVVVPKDADWGDRFVSAVGVGVLAIVGVWGLLLVAHALAYRIKKFRDGVGEVEWALGSKLHPSGMRTTKSSVGLRCKSIPPVSVSALGHVEAVARLPNGEYRWMVRPGFGEGPHNLWFFVTGTFAPPPPGTYEVRWYGTTGRRKQYEITRATSTVPDDGGGVR